MYIIAIVLVLALLVLVYRRPEYGLLTALILISFGPVVDTLPVPNAKFVLITIVFLIEASAAFRRNAVSNTIIIYFAIIFLKELMCYFTGLSTKSSFILAIYVYVIIVGLTYFTFVSIKKEGGDFFNQYKIYIILCLAVQFYRAFIDYSFMGLATGYIYAEGDSQWRPSSLQTPINYCLELTAFTGWMLFKEGLKKSNIVLFVICIAGIVLTFSRSGLVGFFICLLWYFVNSKGTQRSRKIVVSVFMVPLLIILLVRFDYTDRFLEIFDTTSEHAGYVNRFGSIDSVTNQIANFDIGSLLFGKGWGAANYADQNGTILYYVENFYLSLLINSGLIVFVAFIIYILRTLFKGWKADKNNMVLLFSILITNFLAANLLAYTIQIITAFLCFSIMYANKPFKRYVKLPK